jgi:hypothetical protein
MIGPVQSVNAEWIGTEFGLQAAATNKSAAVPTGIAAVLFFIRMTPPTDAVNPRY